MKTGIKNQIVIVSAVAAVLLIVMSVCAIAESISLRYTLYDGGYNFATLLYAVYSDVNGWTIQMEKE